MKPYQIVLSLSNTNSRLEKERILSETWYSGNIQFFQGCILAYDKLLTYGTKQVAFIEGEEESDESTYNWSKFEKLIHKLSSRKLTGNSAKNEIHEAASEASINEWNYWYRLILLKDLKCGVSETTINKVLKSIGGDALKYLIPEFNCQLSHDSNNYQNKIKGKKLLDYKLDGVRIISIIDKKNKLVRQFTRNGKENFNFSKIISNLEKIIDYIPGDIVLDGEVISKSFQALMTQVNRKNDIESDDAKLALFDILPLEDFRSGICRTSQRERHKILSGMTGLFQEISDGLIYVIPKLTVDLDTPEGKQTFAEFNKETIENGFEGIMIKDPEAFYECKRSVNWLKMKPFISLDLEIIGVDEGTGKNKGKLGALSCQGFYNNKKISVSVGSGLTDELREELWKNKKEIIGDIIEIKADAVSQNRDGSYSLRFPRFEKFRNIEKNQKI